MGIEDMELPEVVLKKEQTHGNSRVNRKRSGISKGVHEKLMQNFRKSLLVFGLRILTKGFHTV